MGNSKYLLRQTLKEIFVIALCLTNFNGARLECSSNNDGKCENGEYISNEKIYIGEVKSGNRSDEIDKTYYGDGTLLRALHPASSQNNRCFIPNTAALKNLDFKLHPQNQTIPLDSYVDEYRVVHIECKTKYTLQGQSSLICQNGEWNTKFPTCDGYCDGTLLRTLSLRAICDFGNRYVECPEKIAPETNIQVNCAFGYTRKDKTPQYLRCLPDGSFDKMPEHCEQTCGKISSTSTTLSKNGIEIDVSLAPWHVAIYENNTVDYIYKCGGSIISPSLIITAAHCFWDEATLKVISFTHYTIIAGRSANKYTTEQNLYSQTIKVKEIHVPVEYEGRKGRQKDDIAFLKLETPLKYSETISPICIPKELRSSLSKYVHSNSIGFINIFGPENKLERLKMLTLEYYECLNKSPQDAPLADDKFCVYNTEGSLVCRGDSGGGYFIQSKDSDTAENIYRLWGVVSSTPNTANECTRTGDKAYVAITNIFNTASEFKSNLNKARVEDEALF